MNTSINYYDTRNIGSVILRNANKDIERVYIDFKRLNEKLINQFKCRAITLGYDVHVERLRDNLYVLMRIKDKECKCSMVSPQQIVVDNRGCQSLFSLDNLNNVESSYLDLRGIQFNNITTMDSMFSNFESLRDIQFGDIDTSRCLSFERMFNWCVSLKQISTSIFDTRKAKYMQYMFSNCTDLSELDLSNFDTRKVLDFSGMFYACTQLRMLDISSFSLDSALDITNMFVYCSELKVIDLSNFRPNKNTLTSGCINYCNGSEVILNKRVRNRDIVRQDDCLKIEYVD